MHLVEKHVESSIDRLEASIQLHPQYVAPALPDDPHPLDEVGALQALLEEVGPPRAHPLLPELRFYQSDVLEDVWIRVESRGGRRVGPPFWAFLWPGGLAVARYVLDHPELVAGKRVLDVASGNGVIALACAWLRADATANDVDPLSMRAVELHARLNALPVRLWPGDLLETDPAPLPFEVIAVGDAFYEKALSERLMAWLARAQAAGKQVLVGDPGRNFLPGKGLRTLQEYPVATLTELEGKVERRARVFELAM